MLLIGGGGRTGTISGGCLEVEVQKKAWWLTRSGATWQVTVVDGRSHLATKERFPLADQVVSSRSLNDLRLTERSAAVILTHSYEQGRAVLQALLPRDLAYLGILGPRRRTERLLTEVAPEIGRTVKECFPRLHSPVGLAIGAKNPAGIALAIVAEIHDVIEKQSVKIPKCASLTHV